MITVIDRHQGVSVRPSKKVKVSKAQSEDGDHDKRDFLVSVCGDLDSASAYVVVAGG
jgi:hypothetical protein